MVTCLCCFWAYSEAKLSRRGVCGTLMEAGGAGEEWDRVPISIKDTFFHQASLPKGSHAIQ